MTCRPPWKIRKPANYRLIKAFFRPGWTITHIFWEAASICRQLGAAWWGPPPQKSSQWSNAAGIRPDFNKISLSLEITMGAGEEICCLVIQQLQKPDPAGFRKTPGEKKSGHVIQQDSQPARGRQPRQIRQLTENLAVNPALAFLTPSLFTKLKMKE